MSNPYTIRPVSASEYFVPARGGRGAQAQRILHNICRANPLPDSVSIVGERRFGKTSLLGYLQLAAANTQGLLMAGVDMLSLNPQSPEGFYAMLTESLIEAGELPTDHHTLSYQDFRGFLIKLRRSERRLILFMDEFDLVARDQRFDLSFFDNLRSAATTLPLALVVASVLPLAEIAHKEVEGSPFFNIFREERLEQLSLQEATALISHPPGSERGLSDATEEIITLAGYHPYFLQLACRCAWDLREEEGGKLDMSRLRSAFVTAAHNQYQYIWDHCSSDEQKMLCSLASGIRSEGPALETLLRRGYVTDREPGRICGGGLTDFIRMQCASMTAALPDNQPSEETKPNSSSTLLKPMRVNIVSPKHRLALVIGVNHYLHQQDGQYSLPPLKYAERDAKVITTLLTGLDFSVHQLLGSEATYDTVKQSFVEMNHMTLGDPHPESCFIFHFSGHSQMDPSDDESAYLVLYNTDPENPAITGFKMTHLVYDFLKLVQVPNALVLLDTCHAGFAAGVKHMRPASRLPNVTQQLFAGLRGRMVLAACAGESQAREKDSLEHGVFTHYVLKHWRDLDGYHPPYCINFGSLVDYVGLMIPQDYPELPLPVYSGVGAGGTFILRVI